MTPSDPGGFGCLRHDIGAGVVRVELIGELGASEAATLDRFLGSVRADHAFAVIDLDELTAIDRAGAHVLEAWAAREGADGRRPVAYNARPAVSERLRRLGLQREMQLVDTRLP